MAKMLKVTPPEIEDMPYEWYRDILLFSNTEDLVAKIKAPK